MNVFLTIVALCLMALIGQCGYMYEAESYNRLCGGNATWQDAVFLELRADGSCKP